jgi:thymidine kinase
MNIDYTTWDPIIPLTFAWISLFVSYYLYKKKEIEDVRREMTPVLKTSIENVTVLEKKKRNVGSVICFVGPMFSGKTTKMLQSVTMYADISKGGKKPLIINHSFDKNRKAGNGEGDLPISSHSSQYNGVSKNVDTIYTHNLSDVNVDDYDVIGIDECQFYPDLFETVRYWITIGKHIYCSGLDGCYKAENFGQTHMLLPMSDEFTKLSAVCHVCLKGCKEDVITPNSFVKAPFTSKIAGNKTKKIETGSSDIYIPTCGYHHEELMGF